MASTPDYKKIALDFISDTTAIPNVLLDHYQDFNLSEQEVVFLFRLLRLKNCHIPLTYEEIAARFSCSNENIQHVACLLVEKGFITVDSEGIANMYGLYDKFKEVWGWQRKRSLEQRERQEAAQVDEDVFAKLYKAFEREMGRPLSVIEGEQIKDWFYQVALPADLIYEALKMAVLRGKYSFAYIDKIVMDWHRKQYKTLAEVRKEGEERTRQQERGKANTRQANGNRKYREHQEELSFDDIFEV